MGLFNWFGGRDVTKDWIARPEYELVVDLDRASLGGTTFERPIDEVSWLGPAEDSQEAKQGNLFYYSCGLRVDVKDGLFDGACIYYDMPGFQPFTGKVIYHGGTMPLSPSTTETQAIECFGQPEEREDDGEMGFSIEYMHHDNWFELQFNLDGLLESICVI